MMKRFSRQAGASLIMVIGVSAILVILAMAMFGLVANAQNSRNRDRHRAQTFNAAEAALDDALERLAASWPTTESLSPVWEASEEQAFKDTFLANGLAAQYPTLRIQEWFYDDTTNKPTPVDTVIDSNDYTYDKDGNGRMYVEVQAQDGTRSTRLRVLAQRQTMSLGVPGGLVFYTAGDLWSHGGQAVFGVDPGGAPRDGTQVKAYVKGNYHSDGGAEPAPDVAAYVGTHEGDPMANVFPNSTVPSLESVLGQSILYDLKIAAQRARPTTNYYTSGSQVDEKNGFTQMRSGDPESIVPLPPDTAKDDLSGLVYVETTDDVQWQPKGQWNSPMHPGILVIDGADLKVTGNNDCNYYGLIYVNGGTTDLGSMKVHGVVISSGASQCDLGGDQTLNYNDTVWRNLTQMYLTSVRIVPNTWRELKSLSGVF